MAKKKQSQNTTQTAPTQQQPVTYHNFLQYNFCIGRETTSNGAIKLNGYGDWGLAIYVIPKGERYGIHSPEDFIAKFLDEDHVREDERSEYENITMMSLLEKMPIELEELKPAKSKIKTIEGLPDKFDKCSVVLCNGNDKHFVCMVNAHIYYICYGTS